LKILLCSKASWSVSALPGSKTSHSTSPTSRLLKEMAAAQDELAEELARRVAERREAMPPLPGELTPEEARAFERLGEAELRELAELERAEATIAADSSEELERAARRRAGAVRKLAGELQSAWDRLDDQALAEIAELRERLIRATAAVDQLAADAFADQPQPGTGGEAWREMWEAARRFVEAGGGEFPAAGEDAKCPVCQQGLGGEAHERMHRFEAFVSGELREQVRLVDGVLTERLEGLPDLEEILHVAELAIAAGGEHLRDTADAALEALADRLAIATGGGEPHPGRTLDLGPLRDYVAVQLAEAEGFAVLRNREERERIEARPPLVARVAALI
jgi:hypothetical protein